MRRMGLVIVLLFSILPVSAGLAQDRHTGKRLGEYVVEIEKQAEKTLKRYKEGQAQKAKQEWEIAYFENFEYLEGPIRRNISVKRNSELEYEFGYIRKMIKMGESYDSLEAAIKKLLGRVRETLGELDVEVNPITLFFYSFGIILREGFEAILIICAIIAYLIKTGHKDKIKVIYHSCIIAIILSFITAVLVKNVFRVSHANQEILEGITMLVATLVLFFVSFWLISKVEAHKWMNYIRGKVDKSLTTGNMFTLWFAAFLAVYREGAETVLFYQALGSGPDGKGVGIIFAGFFIGCMVLMLIFALVRFGSVRLPLRQFFIVTSILLYYMAFVFAGKGMMELFEAGLIEPALIAICPTLPFFGIYPYWQAIIPQVFLIFAAFGGVYYAFRKKAQSC